MRQFPMRHTRCAMRYATMCWLDSAEGIAALWTRMIWATFARAARSTQIGAIRDLEYLWNVLQTQPIL